MKKHVTPIILGAILALSICAPIAASAMGKTSKGKHAAPAKDFMVTGIKTGTGISVTVGYNEHRKTLAYYSHSDPETFADALAIAMVLNSRDSSRRELALGRGSYALDIAMSDLVADGKITSLTFGGDQTINFKEENGRFTSMETTKEVSYFYCKVLNYDEQGNVKEFLDASIPTQVFYKDGKVCEINPGYESNKLTYDDSGRLVSSMNYTYLYDNNGRINYIGKTVIEADDPDTVSNIQYFEDGSVKQFDFRGTTYSFTERAV